MKLICPECGKQYDSGKFCPECGVKLQEVTPELVCPSCGYKAKSGKFCPECGTKLAEQNITAMVDENRELEERKFNERDERFAKYYDKKGFPRQIPQEERAIAIEELTLFTKQDIAEAKMLLGSILISDTDRDNVLKGFTMIKEAEQAGDKFAYYFLSYGYYQGLFVEQNHDEAEKRLLEYYKEYENSDAAAGLAELYAFSETKCDYKKAFEYATVAAEDDETCGYLILATLYFKGWGVEKNVELALENYKMAAAMGDETALNQIGYIYMGNEGYDADPEQAFYWCNEAAKKGSDVGMNNLAYCYQNGIGIESDVEKAAEWYKKAAEAGWVDSMLELASYYEEILIDFDKSKMWIQRAAELGNPEAINRLGVIYLDREGNYEEAVKCFEKAIELGVPNAYRNLALCYRDGNGVKKNLKKANELLAKAAELGIEDADEINDEMTTSENNTKVDEANDLLSQGKHKEAFAIYKELAYAGNVRAMANYGNCFMNAWGTKQNFKDGLSWLEKAAKQESGWACLRLAEAYLGLEYNGKSNPVDMKKAKDYLTKARNYGADEQEIANLDEMTNISVNISDVKAQKDLSHNGMLGFEINFKMIANGMIGRKLNISAYCVNKYGDKKCLSKPGTPGRRNPFECHYAEVCSPEYASTVWNEFKIFIPYSEVLNVQSDFEETFVIIAWDQTDKKPEILACEELPYHITCKTHMFRSNEWSFQLLRQDPSKRLVKIPKKKVSVATRTSTPKKMSTAEGSLPMDKIREAANAKYPKESLKALAVAALKIAEVIQERLPEADVSYMVHPSEFDSSVHEDALPIHFLFKKNGIPKVAVVAVTKNGYRTPLVIETQLSCEENGIEYVRVYADGPFADWIQGWSEFTESPVSSESVEFCKKWLVEKISKHL